MSSFWDNWATTHRNMRVAATATGFLLILAWGAYTLRSSKPFNITRTTAELIEINRVSLGKSSMGGNSSSGINIYRGKLVFDDSTVIELKLGQPLPELGDRLPIVIENYENGSKVYNIDWTAWRTGGGR
jgi:hypothetical protein